jgi:dolichol-phosphate mannosyltransferase
MVELSVSGMASFSKKPLRFSYFLGFAVMLGGIIWLVTALLNERTAAFALIVFLQGLMFFVLGILGEYIGRIYDEVRGRPNYIIDKIQNHKEEGK